MQTNTSVLYAFSVAVGYEGDPPADGTTEMEFEAWDGAQWVVRVNDLCQIQAFENSDPVEATGYTDAIRLLRWMSDDDEGLATRVKMFTVAAMETGGREAVRAG